MSRRTESRLSPAMDYPKTLALRLNRFLIICTCADKISIGLCLIGTVCRRNTYVSSFHKNSPPEFFH